jgi:sugar phosphate isomerase/epimerase
MHLAKPRGLEQQMTMLRRCIEIAHNLDVPFLRVFSFWRKELLTPELEARIVAAFEEPVEMAAREGMTLLLENEHACYIGTGAEAARVAQAVNSPHFKLVWDPGNAFGAGETPYPVGYEAVKPWRAHIHVKDARIVESPPHGPQPKWCVVGEGEIDFPPVFAALRQIRYSGLVSVELSRHSHEAPTAARRAYNYLRPLIDDSPHG